MPPPFIARFPKRFADWLNPGENPFKADQETLIWFAKFVKEAELYETKKTQPKHVQKRIGK
jgi:hypothetical protein